MQRREFVKCGLRGLIASAGSRGYALSAESLVPASAAASGYPLVKPMALGLMINPSHGPEEMIGRVHALGFPTCFLSLDGYVNLYTPALARSLRDLLDKYQVVPTAAEVVGPGPLKWNFLDGPSTIGIVPRATRAARIDALRKTSDFARMLGISLIQTHCGFIPEDPRDPLYEEAVSAIRDLADHCAGNHQDFLMETGQETPTTVLRMLTDVGRSNLGVGLDTANLILYGKANPVDAVDIIGRYVRSIHAKDGKWPTDAMNLGEEVVIGRGLVDFAAVFGKLQRLGYTGAVTIERETSGPQQIEDVKSEKLYLEKVLALLKPISA